MSEKTWIVYTRVTDLRNENKEVLKQYDLEQLEYIYVGQCEKNRIEQRAYDFVYKIYAKTDASKNQKNIHIDIDTAITYQNIIKYFIEQKNMNEEQAKNYLFRNMENKYFNIIYSNIESLEKAKLTEREFDGLMRLKALAKGYIRVLNNRDSVIEEFEDDKLKIKEGKNLTIHTSKK